MSVTHLCHAVADPIWRAQWLQRKVSKPPRPRSPKGQFPVKGQLFHKIAENFVAWLCRGRATKTAQKLITQEALWDELYTRFAEKPLGQLAQQGELSSAYHLTQCLQTFCGRLQMLRATCPQFEHWLDLYCEEEMQIKEVAIADTQIAISGQIDAVRHLEGQTLVVVDYKLSQGGNAEHDLLQLAIYAHLLAQVRPGMPMQGELEYYQPALVLLPVSASELQDLFNQIVLPVIREINDAIEVVPELPLSEVIDLDEEVADVSSTMRFTEVDDQSRLIEETFRDFNLTVTVTGRIIAPQLVRYQLRPAPGVKVVSLSSRAKDLQVRLASNSAPCIEASSGYVSVDVPKSQPDLMLWERFRAHPVWQDHPSPMAFPIGIGVAGELLMGNFADANTCHGLVAGSSGSGKSEFLKSVVASLIHRNSPAALRMTIVDPKILTFGEMNGSPYLTDPIITDLETALVKLEMAINEMNRRYQQLSDEGFIHLEARLAAGKTDLPFWLLIFDEFADLGTEDKKEKKRFENLVSKLAAKGRAAGIHLVLATQRPDKEVVTGLIKANLPLQICLRVTSNTNSQIVLGEPGGENLVGKGDLLCNRGKGIERAQSLFLPAGALKSLCRAIGK